MVIYVRDDLHSCAQDDAVYRAAVETRFVRLNNAAYIQISISAVRFERPGRENAVDIGKTRFIRTAAAVSYGENRRRYYCSARTRKRRTVIGSGVLQLYTAHRVIIILLLLREYDVLQYAGINICTRCRRPAESRVGFFIVSIAAARGPPKRYSERQNTSSR